MSDIFLSYSRHDQVVHEGIVSAAAPAGLVGFVVESINAEVAHIHFDHLGSSAGA